MSAEFIDELIRAAGVNASTVRAVLDAWSGLRVWIPLPRDDRFEVAAELLQRGYTRAQAAKRLTMRYEISFSTAYRILATVGRSGAQNGASEVIQVVGGKGNEAVS